MLRLQSLKAKWRVYQSRNNKCNNYWRRQGMQHEGTKTNFTKQKQNLKNCRGTQKDITKILTLKKHWTNEFARKKKPSRRNSRAFKSSWWTPLPTWSRLTWRGMSWCRKCVWQKTKSKNGRTLTRCCNKNTIVSRRNWEALKEWSTKLKTSLIRVKRIARMKSVPIILRSASSSHRYKWFSSRETLWKSS